MYTYVGTGVCIYEYSCPCRPQALAPPGAGMIGSCKLPNMGSQIELMSFEETVSVAYP